MWSLLFHNRSISTSKTKTKLPLSDLTSCLNAHNQAPKQVVLREKWHSSLLVKSAKHKYYPPIVRLLQPKTKQSPIC